MTSWVDWWVCPGTGSLLPSLSVTTREKSAEDPGRARALSIKITCYINNNTSSHDLSGVMHFMKIQYTAKHFVFNYDIFKQNIIFNIIFLFFLKKCMWNYTNISYTSLSVYFIGCFVFSGFFYPQSIAIWLTLEAGCPKLCGLNLGGHEMREMCVPEPKSTALSKISHKPHQHTVQPTTVLYWFTLAFSR